ncbi:MAG: right-handed parallel beta-helix repeat-containing protein [Bacteroidales bacterium]
MKNNILQFLIIAAFFVIIAPAIKAQTNVSGGIYSNTTWTLANSPYIVTDTVVVFPGVTLTIEPGVTVKFENNKLLEIRQAHIIAEGTITDSITFTSNSATPTPGIWSDIYLYYCPDTIKFSYCNFKYAQTGIWGSGDTLTIKNSNFNYNNYGINGNSLKLDSCNFKNNTVGIGVWDVGIINMDNCNFENNTTGVWVWYGEIINMDNCNFKNNTTGVWTQGNSPTVIYMDNCNVSNNQIGIDGGNYFSTIINSVIDSNSTEGLIIGVYGGNDTIINCEIKYNGIGLYDKSAFTTNFITRNVIESNNIGIKLEFGDNIFCNKICNNITYDLYYNTTSNTSIPNNYWCTTDSSIIASGIYDGYDNISLGLVNFMPLDTLQCYLATGITEAVSSLVS